MDELRQKLMALFGKQQQALPPAPAGNPWDDPAAVMGQPPMSRPMPQGQPQMPQQMPPQQPTAEALQLALLRQQMNGAFAGGTGNPAQFNR